MLSGLSRERGPRLAQLGLIAANLAAIALLALFPEPLYRMAAAGAVAAAGAAWVLVQAPALGPIAVVVAALAVPFEVGTGTQSALNLALLGLAALSVLWLVDALVWPERRGWVRSRTVPPLLGLALATLLAFIAGQVGWFGLAGAPMRTQAGQAALYLLSIAAFLIVANRVPGERWLAWLVWAFLGLAAAHVAVKLLPGASRLPATLVKAEGSLFWTWLAALASAQALCNRRLPPGWRLALGALAASPFYFHLVRSANWTAGWLPPLVAVGVVLVLGRPRLAVIVAAIAALLVAANWDLVYARLFLGGGEYGQQWSIYTRGEAWRTALQLAARSPIIGYGPANYYFYTPTVLLINWYVNFVVHNQYLDLLLQTGILGLGCFLWFAAETGALAWRLLPRVPEGFPRAYVLGALGGLAGTLAAGMLVDWVLPNAYNIGFAGFRSSVLAWLFLGGLVVLERAGRDAGARDEGGNT